MDLLKTLGRNGTNSGGYSDSTCGGSTFFPGHFFHLILCLIYPLGRLVRPDIVHFHFTHLGTEIFLPELTLSNTLSSNPKSFRFVDLQFSHKLQFYLHYFHRTTFFIVQRHGSMTTNDYVTQKDQFLLTSLPFKADFQSSHKAPRSSLRVLATV